MNQSDLYYNSETIPKFIEDFKLRFNEDRQFCEELYEHATIYLLASKYAYYLEQSYVSDTAYDNMEKGWYVMGRALGHLSEEETSPFVGWNEKHPLAHKSMELADKLMKKSKKVV